MQPTRAAALGGTLLALGCLGCRTPIPRNTLPIDALRPGMKPGAVRALVGEAEREQPTTWVYEDEVTNPWLAALAVPLGPALILAIPIVAIADAVEGTETPPLWVEKRTTTLYFEDERLERWESEVEPYPAWEDDGSYTHWQHTPMDPFFRPAWQRRGGGC